MQVDPTTLSGEGCLLAPSRREFPSQTTGFAYFFETDFAERRLIRRNFPAFFPYDQGIYHTAEPSNPEHRIAVASLFHAVIDVPDADDVVLAEVRAGLDLDQLQVDLAGIGETVDHPDRQEDRSFS